LEESDQDEVTRLSDDGADDVIIGLQTSEAPLTVGDAAELQGEYGIICAAAGLKVACGTTHDDDGAAADVDDAADVAENVIIGLQTSEAPLTVGDAAEL
jgi:hypothetical protein